MTEMLDSTLTPTQADKTGLVDKAVAHLWRHGMPIQSTIDRQGPIAVSGTGVYITDIDGRTYLDGLSGGSAAATLGHGREDIARAVYDQMTTLQWASLRTFLNPPAIELARRLHEITDGDLETTFYVCSGSEAVETATQMAKSYHRNRGNPGKYKFIYRTTGYHGTTLVGASANSDRAEYGDWFLPLAPGFVETDPCYVYRAEDPDTCESAAAALEETILREGPETVAAVLAESIPAAMVLPPTHHYLRRLREICDRYDVLWIDDEVFIGLGRTGRHFGYQHFDVKPDIVTVSKGLSAGYIPLGAAIASPRVIEVIRGDLQSGQAKVAGHTYSAHPSACAAGIEVLDIIGRENLLDNVTRLGDHAMRRFQDFADDNPYVGDVRGKGFLLGIELVADKETKARLPRELAVGKGIVGRAMDDGFLCRASGDLVTLFPALVANESEIDAMVDATIRAITETLDDLPL